MRTDVTSNKCGLLSAHQIMMNIEGSNRDYFVHEKIRKLFGNMMTRKTDRVIAHVEKEVCRL